MEEFGLFDFLEGVSPWWWVTLGVVLGAFEMATFSYFLIWPGLAAVVIAILLWISPGMSGEAQIAVFAALSIAFTWVGRTIVARTGQAHSDRPRLNRRSVQLIGRHGVIAGRFHAREGLVEIDGVRWKAVSDSNDIPEGAEVRIVGADGMTLQVEPAPRN